MEFPTSQIQEEQTEHKIESGETNQRENRVAIAHHFAVAVTGVKEAVDQPWLASQFRSHPPQDVRDVREGKCEHQNPKQPAGGLQPATPTLKTCYRHQQDKDRA